MRMPTGEFREVPVVREGDCYSSYEVEEPNGSRYMLLWIQFDEEIETAARLVRVYLKAVFDVRCVAKG